MTARKKRAWLFSAMVFAVVTFGGSRAATAPPPDPTKMDAPAPRLIVQMISRQHSIKVFSTLAGPRYSAQTAAGVILAEGLSLDQLRIAQPALYREVHPGIANTSDPIGPLGMIDIAE